MEYVLAFSSVNDMTLLTYNRDEEARQERELQQQRQDAEASLRALEEQVKAGKVKKAEEEAETGSCQEGSTGEGIKARCAKTRNRGSKGEGGATTATAGEYG